MPLNKGAGCSLHPLLESSQWWRESRSLRRRVSLRYNSLRLAAGCPLSAAIILGDVPTVRIFLELFGFAKS